MDRLRWYKLPALLCAAAAACTPQAAQRSAVALPRAAGPAAVATAATPGGEAAAGGASRATEPGGRALVAAAPAGSAGSAGAAPSPAPLQLTVAAMTEHTGGEFGLKVPMLLVTVKNRGAAPLAAPRPGVDLLASLRVVLRSATQVERRRVQLYKPWEVSLQPLPPAGELRQVLSPLSCEQRDAPLAPGRYTVGVCVIPLPEALYPSPFLSQFGGTCSNEIELLVRRGR